MDIQFLSRQLQRCYEHESVALRAWGPEVGRRYIQRLDLILAADTFNSLLSMRYLRLHPLSGDRAGEWSITLRGRWRLIVEPSGDGRLLLIREVSNHYGD